MTDGLPHLLDLIKQREAELTLTVSGGTHIEQPREQNPLLTELGFLYGEALN